MIVSNLSYRLTINDPKSEIVCLASMAAGNSLRAFYPVSFVCQPFGVRVCWMPPRKSEPFSMFFPLDSFVLATSRAVGDGEHAPQQPINREGHVRCDG